MKTLLPILKTKLFVLSFVSACTVILATTVPQIKNFIAPQKAIGEKIKTEQKKIAPKINKQNKTVSASRVTSGVSLDMENTYVATVRTDKPDYYPGDKVIIDGSGWEPGETVTLNIVSDCGCTNVTYTEIADPDGNIHNEKFLITEAHLGASFDLTATGSGPLENYAETKFTDSPRIDDVELGSQTCFDISNNTISIPVDVTGNKQSGGPDVEASLCVFAGLPAGVTASFSPSLLTFTSTTSTTLSSTLTLTFPSSSSFSNFIITVKARTGGPCENPGGDAKQDDATIVYANAAPVFTSCPTGSDLGCNPSGVPAAGAATATDDCGAPVITSSLGSISSNNCSRSQTRTYVATDISGNTATCAQVFTWIVDVTPPGFTGTYTDVNLGCNPVTDPVASLGTATATDACGIITNISSSDGSVVSDGCNRSRTRTFTATDGCLNSSTISRTVRWIEDITPPGFTGSYADVNLGCNPANPDGSLGTATATDACGDVTITSIDGNVVSNGCARSRTRTFTAEDGCHNSSTASRTVRWIHDLTPPTFTGAYTDVDLGCNPANPDGSLGTATATDACGDVTITSIDGNVVSNGCARSRTRTFTAEDGCHNSSTASRTVRWIHDLTPPTFTGSYADVNLGCNPANPDGSLGTATATDACGDVTITSIDGNVVSNGCARSRTRTFTAEDGCHNSSTASRTVRWIHDLTPPTFTGAYTDVDLGCNPANPDGSLGTATATDACGDVTITSIDGNVVSNGCARSRTRTFTAEDGCHNSSTASRTVRWIHDLTPPTFTGSYADVNLGCNPANPDGSLGTATATDACGDVTITSIDGNVVSNGCARSRTRTFTAEDGCHNSSTASRTVRWIHDLTPPTFTGAYTDVDLGCNPANPDGSLGTATATDACGDVTITSIDGNVVSNGCARSRTRTFTAEDGCHNSSTASRTVRWIHDLTPPTFTGSYADVNLGCNPANPDGSLGTVTATDACGDVTITSIDGNVVSNGCARSRTRTFTAEDGCHNSSTASRTVRWIHDLTPPTFTGSYADVNLGCNPANPDGSLGTATATDACGDVTITSIDGNVVSNGCARSRTRTFTAEDGCHNSSTASRTVRWIHDLTPPTFTGSYADVNLGCNPANPDGSLGTATATDACGDVTITSIDGNVVSNGCARSRTRTFTAEDGCHNSSTASRTVRWIHDLTPPTFTGSYADVNLGCNPANPDGSLGTATATDACGDVTITSIDGNVVSNGCARSRTRTFTAEDGCHNSSTASRTVRWIHDLTPPTFTGAYTDVDLGCNPANPDGSLGTATATDACGDVTITSIDGNVVSNGCARSRTRTFTAEDGCHNSSTASRTVRWIHDLTPPTFTGSYADVNLGCNPANPDGSLGTATATDACGDVTITSIDGNVVSNGCARSRTRTFTAEDGCHNSSTASRTVRWIHDLTPPTFTGAYTDVDLGCNPANPDGSLGTATATDACGDVTITSIDGNVVSNGCARSRTRTFTAEDGCHNSSTASRTVRWIHDLTPPTFTGSYADVNLGCNPANPDGSLGTATATDACGDVTITSIDGNVVSNGCARSRTRTFTATDACLNTSTTSRTVRWTSDITGPDITGVAVDKASLWPPNHKMVDVTLSGASATDNCGGVITHQIYDVKSNEPVNTIGDGNTDPDWVIIDGTHLQLRAERSGVKAVGSVDDPEIGRIYTIYYKATDACQNSSTTTLQVTVGHNITNPNPGDAYPINTTVNFAGTFWDVPGNRHTAKWVIDGTSVNGTVTAEPSGNKMGKVTGSFKPTVAGVYKLRMNVTDQKGVTSYATTSGDYEAYFVAYDPKGGFTYGGGQFLSPAGALPARPNLADAVTFGFTSNYYKNATNPKGETQADFKLTDGEYSFAFNALNYDYLSVNGSKAVYKGLGKTIINGVEQSGYAFILSVIDGKNETNPNGVDKIRLKIYNKNTGAVIYDNQMGDPETAEPTMAVDIPQADGTDIVVVSTPTTTSADITAQNSQMEVTTDLTKFNVRAFPNPSEHVFSLVLENATNEKVQITVYDAIGRQVKMFEKQSGNIPIHFGMDLKVGAYIVEVKQGDNRKTLKLVKQ